MNILVNNEIKELSITCANGIEWTQDLIGADVFSGYSEEYDIPIMTSDDYEWWDKFIGQEKSLQARIFNIQAAIEGRELNEFTRDIEDAGDSDYEMMQLKCIAVVDQYEAAME